MWYCGRWERRSAATLIVTFTICVTLVFGFYEHGWLPELLPVTHVLSIVNFFALAAVMIAYFAPKETTPRAPANEAGLRQRAPPDDDRWLSAGREAAPARSSTGAPRLVIL